MWPFRLVRSIGLGSLFRFAAVKYKQNARSLSVKPNDSIEQFPIADVKYKQNAKSLSVKNDSIEQCRSNSHQK